MYFLILVLLVSLPSQAYRKKCDGFWGVINGAALGKLNRQDIERFDNLTAAGNEAAVRKEFPSVFEGGGNQVFASGARVTPTPRRMINLSFIRGPYEKPYDQLSEGAKNKLDSIIEKMSTAKNQDNPTTALVRHGIDRPVGKRGKRAVIQLDNDTSVVIGFGPTGSLEALLMDNNFKGTVQ